MCAARNSFHTGAWHGQPRMRSPKQPIPIIVYLFMLIFILLSRMLCKIPRASPMLSSSQATINIALPVQPHCHLQVVRSGRHHSLFKSKLHPLPISCVLVHRTFRTKEFPQRNGLAPFPCLKMPIRYYPCQTKWVSCRR